MFTTDEFGRQINAPLVGIAAQILAGFGRHIGLIGDIANGVSQPQRNALFPAAAVSDRNRTATLGNYLCSVRPRDHTYGHALARATRGHRQVCVRPRM